MIRKDLRKDYLVSRKVPSATTYDEYVFKKGCVLITLTDIDNHNIRKESGKLYLEGDVHELSELSIFDVLMLLLDKYSSITIELTNYDGISTELLKEVSANFLADFSTSRYVRKQVQYSPVKLNTIENYWTKDASEYTLEDITLVSPEGKQNGQLSMVQGQVYIPKEDMAGHLLCHYKASKLNISLVPEFAISRSDEIFSYS